jgi:predicted nucleic acid-binding Zn ribbon protein
VRKAFAPPTVVFKGSGWAKVDRRSSGASPKRDSGDESSKPKEAESATPASSATDGGSASATKTD